MAMAAIRSLAAKIKIPGPSTLQALRAPGPNVIALLPPPPPPLTDDLKVALVLKDTIEAAGTNELLTSGDLIAESCELIEEKVSIASELHAKAARSLRNVAFRCFCTGFVLSSIHNTIESYYYVQDEYDAEERRRVAAGGELTMEGRLAAVESYLEEVESRLAAVESHLEAVDGRLAAESLVLH